MVFDSRLKKLINEIRKSAQVVNSHLVCDPATGFRPPSATVVSAEPFSHGTGTLQCLQKEMATYRHWSVSLWRVLSPDKTEWQLISATLCRWRRCFVADQLWLMTRVREEKWNQSGTSTRLCGQCVVEHKPDTSWSYHCCGFCRSLSDFYIIQITSWSYCAYSVHVSVCFCPLSCTSLAVHFLSQSLLYLKLIFIVLCIYREIDRG